MTSEYLLVAHGLPGKKGESSELSDIGTQQMQNMLSRIQGMAFIREPLIRTAPDPVSHQSAEILARGIRNPHLEVLKELSDGMSLQALDGLFWKSDAELRGYKDIIVVAPLLPIRDLALYTLIRKNFPGSEDFVANEGGFYDVHSEQYEVPNGGAFLLRAPLKHRDDFIIINPNPKVSEITPDMLSKDIGMAITETPAPASITAPSTPSPAKPTIFSLEKEVDLTWETKTMKEDGRKGVLYFFHDFALKPSVLGMIPGAAQEFREKISSGDKYCFAGRVYCAGRVHEARGTINRGSLNMHTKPSKRSQQAEVGYNGRASALFYSGSWKTASERGMFRAFTNLEDAGIKVQV